MAMRWVLILVVALAGWSGAGAQVVREIAFVGNAALSSAELRTVVASPIGEPFDIGQARDDAEAVQALLARRGYSLSTVTDVALTPEGTLRFVIDDPVVSEIRLDGNLRTRPEVIRRQLTVRVGDVFNERAVRQSLANLQALQLFADVAVAPEPGVTPGTVALTFTVREQRTGFLNVGATYNQIGGLSGYVNVSEANLAGSGQRVSLFLQAGAVNAYQLSYANPWLGTPGSNLGAGLYNREYPHALFAGTERFEFNERRKGGTVSVSRRMTPAWLGVATVRADTARSTPVSADVPAILLESTAIRSLALSAIRDTRASLLYPVDGAYLQPTVETAGLFGGAGFTRVTGDARRYLVLRRLPPKDDGTPRLPWVYAARLTAGAVVGDPPLLSQYYLGGAETLRGYPQDRFLGERMVLLNNELRVPVSDSIHLVGFLDLGDAWHGRYADLFSDPAFTLHAGYGLGVRVTSPLGPLRLDYGINADGGQELTFGIGPTF